MASQKRSAKTGLSPEGADFSGSVPRANPDRPDKSHGFLEKSPAQAPYDEEDQTPFSSIVVGIGASAGGLEAFLQFLQAFPDDLGIALVLIQHLAPQQGNDLPELIEARTRLPVVPVTGELSIQPNHLYTCPPNSWVEMAEETLRLASDPPVNTGRMPIDHFFYSFAASLRHRAVGVILSGTSSDGAAGLREIKAMGGITLVQTPETARCDGMPRAAIATGIVDFILDPPAIAAELKRIARHAYVRPAKPRHPGDDLPIEESHLQQILGQLRDATGVDFTHYKQPTIRRRMQRRMMLHDISSVDHYLKFLRQNFSEIHQLYQDILIPVTRFFRDSGSFDILTGQIFPAIMENRSGERPLRIWVPGCSTGEEAYSVAIALCEFLQKSADHFPIQIFSTDVSGRAIDFARAGVYPDSITAEISPERLRQFFTQIEAKFRINKLVRDLCIFARQDLTHDPPFSRLDLIVCRNVLIYFDQTLQKKLLSVFHYALNPTGFLMLGSAESIGAHAELFRVVDKRHRIYQKKASATKASVDLPAAHPPRFSLPPISPSSTDTGRTGTVQNEVNQILLNRYAPAGVVVDADLQIVQFRGQTGLYLEPAPGEASLNLLKMARPGLLHGLRTALHEVRKTATAVRKEGLRIWFDGHDRDVNLEVIPLQSGAAGRYCLVLFEDVTPERTSRHQQQMRESEPRTPTGENAEAPRPEDRDSSPTHKSYEMLQQELAANRDYLQSIIQELESANEELQSANEEILSSNEELQSTNEELDTAKEELQSTNEELNTLNEELHRRNGELSQVNNDLFNLLANIQIAIVIVACDLRIRRFTPMAERILNLIPTDLGRPISQIKPNIDCPDLERLIQEVVTLVVDRERTVRDEQGRRYSLRIRPYRDADHHVDGAVLALFPIGASQTAAEQPVPPGAEVRRYAESIVNALQEPLVVLDRRLQVELSNQAFQQTVRRSTSEIEFLNFCELGDGQWNITELRLRLEKVVLEGAGFEDHEISVDLPERGARRMLLSARPLGEVGDPPARILLVVQDVTDCERPV